MKQRLQLPLLLFLILLATGCGSTGASLHDIAFDGPELDPALRALEIGDTTPPGVTSNPFVTRDPALVDFYAENFFEGAVKPGEARAVLLSAFMAERELGVHAAELTTSEAADRAFAALTAQFGKDDDAVALYRADRIVVFAWNDGVPDELWIKVKDTIAARLGLAQ